jgi:hypothetical protein
MACRNGAIISVAGVYGGMIDKVSMSVVMNRGLMIKSAQTPVCRYLRPVAGPHPERQDRSELRDHAPNAARRCGKGDKIFLEMEANCEKVVLKPYVARRAARMWSGRLPSR